MRCSATRPVDILTPNVLALQIQPDEGASLQFSAKIPGPEISLGGVRMNFSYKDYFNTEPTTGYETLDLRLHDRRCDAIQPGGRRRSRVGGRAADPRSMAERQDGSARNLSGRERRSRRPRTIYCGAAAGNGVRSHHIDSSTPISRPVIVAPSIFSADLGRLAEEVRAIPHAAGAGLDIHVDVMDGRFVPNITIGPVVVDAVRRATTKPVDVHLMIVEPERYVDDFARAGADHLLVHCEPSATIHLHRTLAQIRELGKTAGVVLNPATPLAMIEYVLDLCGIVLIMTVNPGFGGQQFLPEMLPKIRALRGLCDERGLDPVIEVDGGLSGEMPGKSSTPG